ncbi:transporter substrate-binding domain-containing protein [Burkholderia sp. FERM BP-3421]|jgi:polar amino acid transport system substrate-binding protein|uniref:transporter substrate-binding domain-containing protein n=1 Tax=Burkholderia sp. FERM BP-3421 TaxID=1494466 RepID=UPI002360E974|nr:transporter substrate-binding domain-containing protein [Burkholderia sp. FERM BP-3421]WDD92614.1 transporter substrate-binding domain-containing protein [Burkholderia sp. FERM BP-3421]
MKRPPPAGCLWLAVCLLLAAGDARAADRLAAIRERGVLVVGVKTDYPPFGMLAADASQQGFEHDLAADLARRLGVRLRTLGVTSVNRLQVLNDGRADVTIATLADTTARRRIATLVEPDYYASGVTLMVPPASEIRTWADLRGATVCATQGSYFNRAVALRYQLNLQVYGNGRDAKLAVRDGRCAGWLFDDAAIAGDLRDPAWRGYRIALPSALTTPWALAIARDAAGDPLARFLGDAVADWHRQGTLLALERKWRLPASPFLAAMHALWTRRTPDGGYLCARLPDGGWPVACRNPAFVTAENVTGLRRWGLSVYERTGVNLTYVYDDYERAAFLHALGLTLALTLCCIAGSVLGGAGLALAAACELPLLPAMLRGLALVARMTPPLLQTYVLMFGVGGLAAARWHWRFDAFWVVVLALSACTGAGVMRALDDAAARERVRTPGFRLRPATLGIALRRAAAPLTALLVNVTKATMMASAIAVPELLSVSTSIIVEHDNAATMMNTLTVCFVLVVCAVVWALNRIERRLGDERG